MAKSVVFKILMYIPTLKGGGAERVFVNLANYFSKRDIEVHLFVYNSGHYQSLLSDRVILHQINKKNTFFKRIFFSFFKLINLIISIKPNILFTTLDEANVIGFFALKAVFNNQTKHIVRQANVLNTHKLKTKNLKNKVFNHFNRISFERSDLIISNSNDTSVSLYNYYKLNNKIVTIPNPIDFNSINETLENEQFLFDKGKIYILSVGRLIDEKDYYTALNAFKLVKNSIVNVEFIILGEGTLREELEEFSKNLGIYSKVHMLGFVQNPYYFYKNCNLFLLSSKYEGFGNVLVEALYFGLPIVSTNCSGGPKFILENGKYGSLVNVGDFKEMSIKIIEELKKDSNELRITRIKRSQDFSVDVIGKKYFNALINNL